MSQHTMTDYEWGQRALNSLYIELPAQVASDCIPKLKRIIELYESDNARLRKAIEDALAHQEIVGGSMAKMSTTCRILRNALEEKE